MPNIIFVKFVKYEQYCLHNIVASCFQHFFLIIFGRVVGRELRARSSPFLTRSLNSYSCVFFIFQDLIVWIVFRY